MNNYFGCSTWVDGVCTACSAHYYFNAGGVCCEVDPQCQNFNRAVGICQGCYQGYSIQNGTCVADSALNPSNLGCSIWSNGVCIQCSIRWFFDSNKVCQPVSDLCSTWNSNGECVSCYNGYIVNQGACIVNPNIFKPSTDSLCATWQNQVCITCAPRSYFNANGVCTPVSDNCATWDSLDGVCLTCYNGYSLANGQCLVSSANHGPKDIGCQIWDWKNQVCISCSARWVFNANKQCTAVADSCHTYDVSGACLTCYKGYDLQNGQCVVSSSNSSPSDLGCATWDWNNQVCLQCSARYTFNANRLCVPVSDNCNQYSASGVCTSCYKGYDLTNGICVNSPVNTQTPTDVGCKTWDWNNQVCLECSARWVFNQNKVCVQVADNCAQYNAAGVCTSCYKGFDLSNGVCSVSSSNAHPSDLGCATWDWNRQVCLVCSSRFVFNAQGSCIPVSDNCNQYNSLSGACTSCYKGYDLVNGQCTVSAATNPLDLGCATWDWNRQVCLQCSTRWVFNANNICVQVSDNCNQYSASGVCTVCYKGYDLLQGQCILSTTNIAPPSDSGCKTWDWNNQVCLECSARWTFNAIKVCVPVSDNCNQFDASGACLSCYKGY